MPQQVYLDERGEELRPSAPVYLDDTGEEIKPQRSTAVPRTPLGTDTASVRARKQQHDDAERRLYAAEPPTPEERGPGNYTPPPAAKPGVLDWLKSKWNALNTSLVPQFAQQSREKAMELTTPSLNRSPTAARVRGFFAGLHEGAGDVASMFFSPLGIATTLADAGGAEALAEAGLPAVAQAVRAGTRAASAGWAAEGAHQVVTAPTIGEKLMAVPQIAGGLAGVIGPHGARATEPAAEPVGVRRAPETERIVTEPEPPVATPQSEIANAPTYLNDVGEPIAPVDVTGRELGGYAGPERRSADVGPPAGAEERRLTPREQVLEDLRDNPDIVRQADDMKARADAARQQTPVYLDEHTGEPIGAMTRTSATTRPILDAIASTGREPAYVVAGGQRLKVPGSDYGMFGRAIAGDIRLADGSEISVNYVDRVEDSTGRVLWERQPSQEESHATTAGEQPERDLEQHLGTDAQRESAALAEADHRDRAVEREAAPGRGNATSEAEAVRQPEAGAVYLDERGEPVAAAAPGRKIEAAYEPPDQGGPVAASAGAHERGPSAEGSGPPRTPGGRDFERETDTPVPTAAETLDTLTRQAVDAGWRGDPEALHGELRSRLELVKELDSQLADSGRDHRVLLNAIKERGGISIPRESAQKGELRWLSEHAAGASGGTGKGAAFGRVGGISGVFNRRGLSFDDILQSLRADGRFNHLETLNDLFEELRAAASYQKPAALVDRFVESLGPEWWTRLPERLNPEPVEDALAHGEDGGDVSFNPAELEAQNPHAAAVREWSDQELQDAHREHLQFGRDAALSSDDNALYLRALEDERRRRAASEAVDTLDTGEEQPRLPEAGRVRDEEHATPAFEAPFSLEREAAQTKGKQDDLFGGGKGQGRLASSRAPRDVELQSTVVPGAKEFVEQDVIPGLKQGAETVGRIATDIERTFSAAHVSDAAEAAGGILRARSAELAHRTIKAQHALEQYGKLFDRMKDDEKFAFIDDIEHGRPTSDPNLRPIQQALRKLLDERRREVQVRGRLQQVIRDYFPHIWKDPGKAQNWLRGLFGKRPLQGPKNFLKQRSIPTTAEGRAAGLVPVSSNPVTLTLLKVREMDKWITGHDALEDMKAAGIAQYVPVGTEAPAGSVRINDPIGTVYGNPNVPVHEALDEGVYGGLSKLADDLGITHERATTLKGGPRGAWGLSHSGQGRIQTRTGGPESVLAHEIGHQVDEKYGLWNRIHREAAQYQREGYEGWSAAQELRAITDLTWEGKQVDEHFKKYVRKKEEKIANMIEAYVHAPEQFKRVAPNIYNVLDEIVDRDPVLQQLRDIKPTLKLMQRDDSTRIGGMVVNGHWWAPEEAALVLNRHLSPGLAGNALYDVYRATGNVLTQAKFALSAFHAIFEASESVLSKAALTMQYGTPRRLGGAGEPLLAAKKAGEIVVAPFVDYFRGAKALREYYTKDPSGKVEGSAVDQIIQGGGRVKWDDFYKTNAAKAFTEALRQGNYPGAVLRAPFAAAEAAAKPIMEHLVPRLKIGAYLDLAQYELRKLPHDATPVDVQRVLGRAWDSIDNRFGELVYDNLFWPKWLKDTGQISLRALGWNVGTVREVGGAARDIGKYGASLATGKTPELTPKMAYGVALGAVGVAFQGAVMQYLMTGEKPRDLEDLIFPRTGRMRPDGHPERMKLWTYAGDIYEAAHHPVQTIGNKVLDLTTALTEIAQNRDWRHVQIHDPDAPLAEQATQVGKWALEKAEPISMSNAQRARESGRSGALSFLGVGEAPGWVGRSKAEDLVYQFTRSEDTRTLKQEEARQQRQELRDNLRQGNKEGAREVAKRGELGARSVTQAANTARLSALQAGFKKLTIDQALKVYQVATIQERAQLRALLGAKIQNGAANIPPAAAADYKRRFAEAKALPSGKPKLPLKPASGQ